MIRLAMAEGIKNRNTMKKKINTFAGTNFCFNFVILQIIIGAIHGA